MATVLNAKQLTGLDESHLVSLPCGARLQADAARAFTALQADAARAGFELAVASSFRSFARQLAIFNGKAAGLRPVYDDAGQLVPMSKLAAREQLHAILRFSALPGTSRHHWGTDLDVYDAAAVPADYVIQLSSAEVASGGVFDALHCWLDERMAQGESHGFYRPYACDRGGVAAERWHLSYAPLSRQFADGFDATELLACWDCEEAGELLLQAEIRAELPEIFGRYVEVPPDWCGPA